MCLKISKSEINVSSCISYSPSIFNCSPIALFEELINKLIKKYPSNPYFYELKAQMLRENGFLKESLNNYLIVNKLLPNDDRILYNVGLCYSKLGEEEDAARKFREALKINSEDSEIYYALGKSYLKLNKNKRVGGILDILYSVRYLGF